MVPGNGFQNHLQGRVREAYPPSSSAEKHFFFRFLPVVVGVNASGVDPGLRLFISFVVFFLRAAFRPAWPGRCVLLSFSLCTTSQLAP